MDTMSWSCQNWLNIANAIECFERLTVLNQGPPEFEAQVSQLQTSFPIVPGKGPHSSGFRVPRVPGWAQSNGLDLTFLESSLLQLVFPRYFNPRLYIHLEMLLTIAVFLDTYVEFWSKIQSQYRITTVHSNFDSYLNRLTHLVRWFSWSIGMFP